MTTVLDKNVYNIAIKGTFDDCQYLVKEMFNDQKFRNSIQMSGVNSICGTSLTIIEKST